MITLAGCGWWASPSETSPATPAEPVPGTPAPGTTPGGGATSVLPFVADTRPDIGAATGPDVGTLSGLRLGAHSGFDRFVLEFDGPDVPSD